MLKELSWYIEKNRFTDIVEEIEEKAEAYRHSMADALDDSGLRREEFRQLCQWHMEKSGYRNEDSSFIDIDSEFLDGSEINRKALDTFEKEIIKAHMYQKHLWEFMGTTGTMTVITKTEMASNGQKYEDYLPIEFKKNNEPRSPISGILAENPNAVPIYIYPDGTASSEYDGSKSKARFDTIKDRSGFDWRRKGWDPNYEIQKDGWHGEFDGDGSWIMVREERSQSNPDGYSGARFDRFPEIEILKDGENAILYDPQYSLLSTFERIYLVSDGDVYGSETTDATETVRLIKDAMTDMGIRTITSICGGRTGKKSLNVILDRKEDDVNDKRPADEKVIGLYRNLLGEVLSGDACVKTEKEYAHMKEDILRKAGDERKSAYGMKLAEKIGAARQEGARGSGIADAVVSGKVNVPLSVFNEQDRKLAGLTDEEASMVQTYAVPDEKKALFSTTVLNLILDRKELMSTGKSMDEFLDAAYADIVLGKESDETISLETTFSELCSNPEKTLKAEPAEEGVMQLLLQAKQNLPKQKNPEVQERVNRAVDNIIRNFGAVRMSTGMTPEEAVKLAAKTAGGKDSDVFVPPASGIVYKSSTGRDSGGDRRIFSDIKLSEFIAKAKNRPAMTKEVELERMIQRIGKIQESDTRKDDQNLKEIDSTAIGASKYLPNLLNKTDREAWYKTDEFKATALSIEEVEKLAAMEEENYASMKPSVPSETRSYSIERKLDEKYGYGLPADVSHESPVMARIVPATRSRSGQETAGKLEVEHASSSYGPAKHQEAVSSISDNGLKFRAASTDASGRISRQISAAVWSDRLLHDKFKKSAIEEKDDHVNGNGNHISEMDNGKNHIDRYEEANGKESPLPAAASVTSSAGKLSGATWNRTSDVVSHESTDVRNNPDTHTDMLFNGRVPDQEAMESSHGRYTGDISEKTPASKPAQQKNSGKMTESTPFPVGDEEADRLERMNANYEHDRAILAKTDPAFAKNQFWDVGYADGNEELENMEIERIVQKSFNNGISEIIKGAQ
ncbi:MAG: hypothetical protein PUK78_02095 [Spirochaetales bacterium]|nr:hypothetical protein [Spirochaetales bacterium]